jgi:hypothetical protein
VSQQLRDLNEMTQSWCSRTVWCLNGAAAATASAEGGRRAASSAMDDRAECNKADVYVACGLPVTLMAERSTQCSWTVGFGCGSSGRSQS